MVQLPQTRPPAEKPAEQPVVQQAQPEIKPEQAPKELPKPKPEIKPVEQKPQPEVKVEQPDPEPEAAAVDPEPEALPATATVPNIAGTDETFPFAWYISLVEGKVVSNWDPVQLSFGKRNIVSCTIHFRIARNGTVSQVTLVRNSGVGVYDREALRAVKTTRLPPLPPQYKGTSLGITFIFNQEPGQ